MAFNALVSADWLQQNLSSVTVIDGSYYLASMGKNADDIFNTGHIPGAQRWNIDQIADHSSNLKHMMPGAQVLADAAGQLGITSDDTVVIYDQIGMFSAARVWLAFKTLGHKHVALLNGGLPAWQGEQETGAPEKVVPVDYGSFCETRTTVDRFRVLEALDDPAVSIIDARSAARFNGTAPEPVAGLLGGHMPSAISLPFNELLDNQHRFLSVDALQRIFNERGLLSDNVLITSCGSGVTASIISFALALVGRQSLVYDGSWSEWGQPALASPIVSGTQ